MIETIETQWRMYMLETVVLSCEMVFSVGDVVTLLDKSTGMVYGSGKVLDTRGGKYKIQRIS